MRVRRQGLASATGKARPRPASYSGYPWRTIIATFALAGLVAIVPLSPPAYGVSNSAPTVSSFAVFPVAAPPAISVEDRARRPALDRPSGPIADLPYIREAQFVRFGGSVPIPLGYYRLCLSNVAVCRPGAESDLELARDGAVLLTPRLLARLTAVNRKVNRRMRQVPDKMIKGVANRWTIGGRTGDCEDFALTKRQRLIARGWPSSALLLALATTDKGRLHAVLVVRTHLGDLVLDSLRREIRGWQPSLYRWEEIQSPNDPWAWLAFGDI